MAQGEKAVFKVFIRGTIDAVWREITKSDEPQGCFFDMWMKTSAFAPGGKLQMRSRSGKYVGAVGEILEFDPPRRFAHTFRFTTSDDPPCRVQYDLIEKQGGVEFVMTLTGLAVGAKSTKQMVQGGPMICATLKSLVERGRIPFGTRALYTLFRLLEPMQPSKLKVEHWPL